MSSKERRSQSGLALTPAILRPVNSLTRASPRPGFLDYGTYLRLLIQDGHVKISHPASSPHAPAHPIGSSLQVVSAHNGRNGRTDFRADQALWSQDDLPHLLYLLGPPPNWINEKYLKEPPLKTYRIHGKILRNIPILPDHISSKLEGWRLQAWYCFDPRVKLGDILTRMGNAVSGSTVQMRSLRFRTDFPAIGWASPGPKFDAEKLRIEGLMQEAGLDPASKTTRGLAWGAVDPDNEDSGRIAIPSKKEWESSVEEATAALLSSIQSTVLSGHSISEIPVPVTSNTLDSHYYNSPPSDNNSDYTVSAGEAGDIEDDLDMLEYETETHPTPQIRMKRKFVAPRESAWSGQSTSGRVARGLLPIRTAANADLDGAPQFAAANCSRDHGPGDISPFGYQQPEEVPRAPSIGYPLQYQQWLADDLRSTGGRPTSEFAAGAADLDVLTSTHRTLDNSGAVHPLVLYDAKWLALKTLDERQNLSHEECELLHSFFPVGSEGRCRQLEYLLNPDQAQFGFEDRNGQWGQTNWDWNMASNIHYAVSRTEARALLAANMRQLAEQQLPYDYGARLRFHPSF